MKTVASYPITFGYLATTTINGKSYTHRGQDRSCTTGTPLVIGNTTVALSGNTGLSTGPHVHLQCGTDPGTQQTINPSKYWFKGGTVTALRTTDTGQWGKFVTIKSGSVYCTYAHLSKVNVKVGQIIKEETPVKIEAQPPVFDVKWYRNRYGDLARNGVNTNAKAVEHWLKNGIKEGRESTKDFAVKEYLANYADLRKAYGSDYLKAVRHYYNNGISEGRSGRKIVPDPQIAKLKTQNTDLAKKVTELGQALEVCQKNGGNEDISHIRKTVDNIWNKITGVFK